MCKSICVDLMRTYIIMPYFLYTGVWNNYFEIKYLRHYSWGTRFIFRVIYIVYVEPFYFWGTGLAKCVLDILSP